MTDLLVATLAALLIAAVGLVALAALTLAPFVVTVALAERRRLGAGRWGVAAGVCSALGLGVASVSVRHQLGLPAVVLGALAAWSAPLALAVLGGAGGRPAGVRGRHE